VIKDGKCNIGNNTQRPGICKEGINGDKKHMVDIDSILTEDDYKALQEYNIEKSEGKLTSHEELKKELGL
jgi:hypothetical protein